MTNEELLKVIEEVKASKATALDLSLNKLTALPPELFQLRYLTWLNLSGNQLNSLPSAISKLTNLTWLDLSGNQLNSLPLEICKLPELETLRLGDNPLVSPPLEIATQGIEAMRQYFAELNSGTQFLNEVKILVVGDGEAGKTSLVKRLFNEIFDQAENPTHGINIRGWDVEVGGRKLKANIWDFGGQVMQHATHQFFFSKRCSSRWPQRGRAGILAASHQGFWRQLACPDRYQQARYQSPI
jgi:internalin A